MKDLEALIKAAATNGSEPEYQEIFIYCEAMKISPEAFCNEFSIVVAKSFQQGALDYNYCNEAMNYLWGFITTPPVFGPDKDIPEPAFSVYKAFDEGEILHKGDSAETDPIEKYTKPIITEILSRAEAS